MKKVILLLGILGIAAAGWLYIKGIPNRSPKPSASATASAQQPAAKLNGAGAENSGATAQVDKLSVTTSPPDQPEVSGQHISAVKFDKMSLAERDAVLSRLKQLDYLELLQKWVDAWRLDNDGMKEDSIITLLAYRMRKTPPPPEFLEAVRKFILDDKNPIAERNTLTGLLGLADTKESVEALLQLAVSPIDNAVKRRVYDCIATVTSSRGDGKYHEELAIPLEHAWENTTDPEMLSNLAIAMANVGASSSIKLLVEAVLNNGDNSPQKQAARYGFSQATILNPNAAQPFVTLLNTYPVGSQESRFASDTLAASGMKNAGGILARWLESADESAAPLVHDYVVRTKTVSMTAAWEAALNPQVPFKSEKNREAIREALASYRQERGSSISH